MRKEFLIDRQGKTFALFAGLLDEAHQNGLRAIRTAIVQAPTKENGETTIVHAEVEMGDGRVFSGIGDANPQNVGRNIAMHSVRMAETRAKARALRDAINVGTVALEELGGDDDDAPAYQSRQEQRPLRAQNGAAVPVARPSPQGFTDEPRGATPPAEAPHTSAETPQSRWWPTVLEMRTKLDGAGIPYTLPPSDQDDTFLANWLTRQQKTLDMQRRGQTAQQRGR